MYLHEIAVSSNFAALVFFTDEVALLLEDVINIHNLHSRAFDNFHATHTHVGKQKLTLYEWTKLVEDVVLNPYMLSSCLDGFIDVTL